MVSFPLQLDIYVRDESGNAILHDQVSLTKPATYTLGRLPDKHIVLDSPQVSRSHALLIADTTGLEVVDQNSTFGTFLDGKRIEGRKSWTGGRLRIDPFEIVVVGQTETLPEPAGHSIEVSVVRPDKPPVVPPDTFPGSVFKTQVVDVGAIRAGGYILGEYEYLALGGGLGSFAWVDHLRIFGVPAKAICVVGSYEWDSESPSDYPRPYGNYRRLCQNSQIPGYERLRSNSISTPDNIWGFPGYASRETWRDLKQLRLGGLRHVLQVFGEPAVAESYTPRSDDVFKSIDREAARIGWREVCLNARVVAMRKTSDGRYAVAIRLDKKHALGSSRDRVVIGKFVHLATGYPAYRTEDDVFRFNGRYLNEGRVFKAYDRHESVYDALEQKRTPALVVVRGRGIVASRILQRLHSARKHNDQIKVLHQMRTAIGPSSGARFGSAQRAVFNNTELQPFNWPKSCWGGELRALLESASPETRSQIIGALGGTTTARRRDWTRIVQEGHQKGWYQVAIGRLDIKDLTEPGPAGRVLLDYAGPDSSIPKQISADYVIDCIGLIGDVTNSEFLGDLVRTYQLQRNRDYKLQGDVRRGLAVTRDFEVAGLRQNGGGRVYAAGQITNHGPHAAVDSFLGLQYAALRSVDHLNAEGAPFVSRFGVLKSFSQWLRWCFNRAP
ncbi:FHA domain-containing protein [Bradyrhizobium sp. 180]|uniref:FHA domain-containing protein n=1 Tax=Bradyrhizobium sp. 180 TaxID=2782650 RepID=UPI001FFA738D|nr:FHA domain-containing protein [Bradyrhizobium sp. 180]MCK1489746.1 FHA domain-containing protein [Bradyrhizobium sp. 180]